MLKSMTGFGHAKITQGKDHWIVEIRSLNHRYLEYTSRLPQSIVTLENEIKNVVQTKLKRGKVSVYVSQNGSSEPVRDRVVIDEEKINFYFRSLKKIAHKLGIEPKIALNDILGLPNIFLVEKDAVDAAEQWPKVKKAVEKALQALIKMKAKEGQALKREISGRLSFILDALKKIELNGAKSIQQYQDRLKSRVSELTSGVELDPEKLAREVAIMADRSDITEEMVRLKNHISLFRSTLEENEEVGKKLDFISQEMNREANTIASKSASFDIAKEVVKIKAEIEKIREQIQNIE